MKKKSRCGTPGAGSAVNASVPTFDNASRTDDDDIDDNDDEVYSYKSVKLSSKETKKKREKMGKGQKKVEKNLPSQNLKPLTNSSRCNFKQMND